MHLYLYARGKFEQVELWKTHVQAAYWKWRRKNNKTGKEEISIVQGGLRPSVLGAYEYIFPKEALTEVCSFMGIEKNEQYGFGTIGLYARHFCLRTIFGVRKIPKEILKKAKELPDTFSTLEFERAVSNCKIPGVVIHVIGIKDDTDITIGDYTHEAL